MNLNTESPTRGIPLEKRPRLGRGMIQQVAAITGLSRSTVAKVSIGARSNQLVTDTINDLIARKKLEVEQNKNLLK